MKSKNCQKVVLKALGHILYGSNFIASDVIWKFPRIYKSFLFLTVPLVIGLLTFLEISGKLF